MRVAAVALLAGLAAPPAQAEEPRPPFPTYDIDGLCRAQANYSFAATLGDTTFERIFHACQVNASDARDCAASLWRFDPVKDLAECPRLAEGRYTRLARCLDGGGMRTAR